MARDPGRPRFVAGSIGPTAKTASMSPRVEDPGYRAVTFDQHVESYYQQVAALIEGGVDLLFPETTFDTLNLKACLFAIARYFEEQGRRGPGDGIGHDHGPGGPHACPGRRSRRSGIRSRIFRC